MSDDFYLDELDRKFLNLSSSMADVFSWTYGMLGYRLIAPIDPNKFDNASSRAKEIGIRAMIVLGAIASVVFTGMFILGAGVVLWSGSKTFRAAAFHFQTGGFSRIAGRGEEAPLIGGRATVMTWSIEGHQLHFKQGVVHWRSRVDRIISEIKQVNPDIIVLEKVYDPALVEAIVAKLEDQYPHFYAHMGESTWSHGSGLMVITRCAPANFTYTPFKDQASDLGFAMIEMRASPQSDVPCVRIIGTELADGVSGVAQIVDRLAKEGRHLPTLFVGSCRDVNEQWTCLSQILYHSYRGKEPTFSDKLMSEWTSIYGGKEERQFISLVKRNLPEGRVLPIREKGVALVDSRLVEGFDPNNPSSKTALSNSHAIVTTLQGL